MAKSNDIERERLIALETLLLRKGFNLAGSFELGKKINVTPVRIGMPGQKEEGRIFGAPKRNTQYPVDAIKVIREKDDRMKIKLTNKGRQRIREFNLEGLSLQTLNNFLLKQVSLAKKLSFFFGN